MSDDRTAEFLAIASSLPPVPVQAPPQPETKAQAYRQLREFHETAGGISRDIAGTSALLQQLASLVRQQSALQGDASQMNDLVVRIKQSIENLNSRIDQASRDSRAQKQNAQASQQARNMVQGLQTEFAQAATGFKDILQERTDGMNQTDLQKQVYGQTNDDDEMPAIPDLAAPFSAGDMGLDLTSSLIQQQQPDNSLPRPHGIANGMGGSGGVRQRHNGTPNGASSYYSTPTEVMSPYEMQQMEEAQGLQQQLIPESDYLESRANAMETVEANIVELGTIFNRLAVMVNEHADMVQRVEDNVEEANMNINLSLATLTDTLLSLKTNKKLALRIGAILTLFIIFFIVAVA